MVEPGVQVGIQLFTFLFTVVAGAMAGTRALNTLEVNIRNRVDDLANELRKQVAEIDREAREEIEAQSRRFGETAHAIREDVNQLKLYVRDTYVRRDSFMKVQEQIAAETQAHGKRMEECFERIERKIESERRKGRDDA